MGALFRSRQVRKTYWAVTSGVPEPLGGTVDFPLGKDNNSPSHKVVCQKTGAMGNPPKLRQAITRYEVLDRAGMVSALVAVYPETGRTHQVRAHLAMIGNAIVGDRKYRHQSTGRHGKHARNSGFLANCTKLHLHALSLSFVHPVLDRRVRVAAPPPDYFVETCNTFGWPLKHLDSESTNDTVMS